MSMKGRGHTPASRAKIAAARRGTKMPEWVKKKISESLKGREVSADTRAKISESLKAKAASDPEFRARLTSQMRTSSENRKGKPRSAETKAKISKTKRERDSSHTLEIREKIAASKRGRPRTAETRAAISEGLRRTWAARKKVKEVIVERPAWRGGSVTVRKDMSVRELRDVYDLTLDEISDVKEIPRVDVFSELGEVL